MAMTAWTVDFVNLIRIVFFCRLFCDNAGPFAIGAKVAGQPCGPASVTARTWNFINLRTVVGRSLLLRDDHVPFAKRTKITNEPCQSSAATVRAIDFIHRADWPLASCAQRFPSHTSHRRQAGT